MTQEQFWRDLQHIDGEVDHALSVFHTYEEIIRLGAQSARAFSAFNMDAMFWNTQAYCLQQTLFMILSRLVEDGPDCLTVRSVLNSAASHPEFFSRQALERRVRERKIPEEYIENLLEDIWTPEGESNFKHLKKALEPHAARIAQKYRPIRDNYIGHNIIGSTSTIRELFAMTNRAELSKMLDFLHELVAGLINLYLNGVKPDIGARDFDSYNGKIAASARRVVQKVVGGELFTDEDDGAPEIVKS